MELDRLDVPLDHLARAVDPQLGEQETDLRRWAARISSFVSRSHSWRLNGPSAFLRVVYTNCWSVWSGLALVERVGEAPRLDLAVERLGEGGVLVEQVLEAGREVDLGRLDRREAVEQLVGQGRRAVLDGAGQAVLAGDLAEPRRTSKSSSTSATPPSGSGTPPCDVPVWTLTLEMPVAPGARASSSRR